MRRVGFRPVGMVVGMSVYQIAVQGSSPPTSASPPADGDPWVPRAWERDGRRRVSAATSRATRARTRSTASATATGSTTRTCTTSRALGDTFRLAHDRLQAEAAALGAHGVVGVRHTLSDLQVASSAPVVELKMVGTAITPPERAAPLDQPFTSHLSGQQFAKLTRHRVGARRASCSGPGRSGRRAAVSGCRVRATWSGAEFVQRSEAVQQAQRTARSTRSRTRRTAFGEQVIGVDVALSIREGAEAAMVRCARSELRSGVSGSHEDIAVPRTSSALERRPTMTARSMSPDLVHRAQMRPTRRRLMTPIRRSMRSRRNRPARSVTRSGPGRDMAQSRRICQCRRGDPRATRRATSRGATCRDVHLQAVRVRRLGTDVPVHGAHGHVGGAARGAHHRDAPARGPGEPGSAGRESSGCVSRSSRTRASSGSRPSGLRSRRRLGHHERAGTSEPGGVFTSDLSGKDFALLTAAGYERLGLVMGVCVYHVARQIGGHVVEEPEPERRAAL